MICRVPVHPGDVYYMPAGMVHAIGGGILLYEIQQSSALTYRLWDYNRVNAAGEKRPLHLRKALDVIQPQFRGLRTHLTENAPGQVLPVLRVPAFTVRCAYASPECLLPAEPEHFRVLTALEPLTLSGNFGSLSLAAGDTAFLPAACGDLRLTGTGRALISSPGSAMESSAVSE